MDGFRCLAFRRPRGGVTLQSRQQRQLTPYFPEVVAALQDQLIGGIVLDGELVVCTDGRLNFVALQRRLQGGRARRLAADAPACLVVFDILAVGVDDLRGLPYVQRRGLVADLLAAVTPPLALMPMTTEQAGARAWLTDHTAAGIEGVVVKHPTHAYRPAQRTWQKVRTRVTAEASSAG
jgi:ATP-dependent DNA ligase